MILQGGAANDTFTLGASGINLNKDADGDDVTLTGVERVRVSGGDGKDVPSGAGGLGTGDPLPLRLNLSGEDGNVTLTGGTSFDLVAGGSGNDKLEALMAADSDDLWSGGAGTDTMLYSERTGPAEVRLDDLPNDGSSGLEGDKVLSDIENVTTGQGNDTITDGGTTTNKTFKAGKGNDSLQADDGIGGNDTADGGGGTDTCTTDPGDTRKSCEL